MTERLLGDDTVGMRVRAELVDLPGGDYKVPVFRLAAGRPT
jgi:hypothetical protein